MLQAAVTVTLGMEKTWNVTLLYRLLETPAGPISLQSTTVDRAPYFRELWRSKVMVTKMVVLTSGCREHVRLGRPLAWCSPWWCHGWKTSWSGRRTHQAPRSFSPGDRRMSCSYWWSWGMTGAHPSSSVSDTGSWWSPEGKAHSKSSCWISSLFKALSFAVYAPCFHPLIVCWDYQGVCVYGLHGVLMNKHMSYDWSTAQQCCHLTWGISLWWMYYLHWPLSLPSPLPLRALSCYDCTLPATSLSFVIVITKDHPLTYSAHIITSYKIKYPIQLGIMAPKTAAHKHLLLLHKIVVKISILGTFVQM